VELEYCSICDEFDEIALRVGELRVCHACLVEAGDAA
jgi:hypothetical protein